MRPWLLARANSLLGRPGWVSMERHQTTAIAARIATEGHRSSSDADLAARAFEPQPDVVEFLARAAEAARRQLCIAPHDTQLAAAAALVSGLIVEMDTGEGKTLAGALAASVQVLSGRHVHVLSVNDYLAERDARWMSSLYALLGISVGWIGQASSMPARREAYTRDVVYVSVSELGFDVLRDRLATAPDGRVSPRFDVAIVDEADSVMIDEATTPLVLAGESATVVTYAKQAAALVAGLDGATHVEIDSERTTIALSDAGYDLVESTLGGINLHDEENLDLLIQINLALHAAHLVRRDVDYLITDGAVQLVNTARGRVADAQRWPDGLHAAIEAQEQLEPSPSGIVLDTLTVQELLVSYPLLSGMTGTAVAVAAELHEFYGVQTGRIERRLPNRRIDESRPVSLSRHEANEALLDEVQRLHREQRPILVGTQSVAESDDLAARLAERGIVAAVLNARNDADEADVIAAAGRRGAVTISTQMSGRGVDIVLGAHGVDDDVAAIGGLAVVASGRYASRRLDAQLRGRAGRQGDPGSSVIFASLEDDLVQRNAPVFVKNRIARKGARMDARSRLDIVDDCQNIAEGVHLDRQQSTWNYNRAISLQRAAVLRRREGLAAGEGEVLLLRERTAQHLDTIARGLDLAVIDAALRNILVFHFDVAWQDHLGRLTELRDGIHLRALSGDVPFEEFHRIALGEFEHFWKVVHDAAAATVEGLAVGGLLRPLDDLGLRRPATTWTYMVSDNPLGTPHDRLRRRAAGRLRRWRQME
ncbi:accessory Sec system translocase SecA2 [Subtercola boreus]|uniref:Protein translocase subunit SecA n=1 Tax=Subtercola boreus TaxID=120213 RepID=A0A3E0W9I6_9MICO|nr:accessory Sec system translocase SecA2 [Subtercola boreus]RFA19050.1 accessory Sec system translocase SecA2 [Subtercola boreus]RFA19188.1 accessory Sec system translocase SecA2 [Subtercola boreus]RFA25650.1 accessory Sec system translocase SecA2 [Subtercola boreus]